MSAPKAVLFDWDNTLVDTWPTIHEAINHTMRTMGHAEWSFERVKSEIKQSMRDSFPVLFGDQWERAADAYQASFRAIHLERLRALDGAEDMLGALRQHNIYIALVSNKKGVNLRKEVTHLGWDGFFDAVVGAQDASHDKPNPAPALMALENAPALAAHDIWFVGDTGVDLECAKNIGAMPVLYGDQQGKDGLFEGFPYRYYARDHRALRALFEEMFQAA